MAEGINAGQMRAEKMEANQIGAQQVSSKKSNAGNPQILQQGDGTEKLGAPIEHNNCRYLDAMKKRSGRIAG
jgi:hypothetical protein